MEDEARAKALMLADLGIDHRHAVSAPLDPGMSASAEERRSAAILAEDQARRDRIIDGKGPNVDKKLHTALSKWNTPKVFSGDADGDEAEDLQNLFNGQGHRNELRQRFAQHNDGGRDFQDNRFGDAHQRGGHGPRGRRPPTPVHRAPLIPVNANRQRAPSPRASGTVRFPPARQGAAPTPAGIPNIGANLASAVQARSTAGNPSVRTPALSSTISAAAIAPHTAPAPTGAAAPILPPRSASPALSTASSTSTQAVTDAQARLKARFAALQKAKSATPIQSPTIEAASTANAIVQVSAQTVDTSNTDEPSDGASTQDSGDLHSPWPTFGPTAGATDNQESPAVADAQAMIKDRVDSPQRGNTTRPIVTTAGQTSVPARTTAPHLARTAVTGAVNRAVIHASSSTTNGANTLVPRGRATATVNNMTASNGVGTNGIVPRSRVTTVSSSSPASTINSASPIVTLASRPPSAAGINTSVGVARLPNKDAAMIRIKVDALKRDLDEVEPYYTEYPELRPALDDIRQRLARKVVQLAAVGDKDAAEVWCKGRRPDRHWLVDAAFSSWSGETPEDPTHPTVQEIIKATKVEKKANEPKETVATPAAQPISSNTSNSAQSSATADSNSTAVSTPTPPRTVMGMLTAAFYGTTGRFLGSKEYPLSEPITVHVAITSKADDFDPLQLADDMEALAKKHTGRAATV